ncbi:Glyceraldehyde-3-phosphate dehydrogenase, partial [Daphnia magna]
HQRLGPFGQGAQRQMGHPAWPDDHRARGHRHPKNRGRPEQQRLARRARHFGKHHPQQHGRGQGRGRGDSPRSRASLTGVAVRVPTSDVSLVDLTVELGNPATYAEICAEMKA